MEFYLDAERFDVVRSVGTTSKIRKIELNLIPAVIETHRHRTDEWFDTRRRLIITRTETTTNVSIVQNLSKEEKKNNEFRSTNVVSNGFT